VYGETVEISPNALKLKHGSPGGDRLLLYGNEAGVEWYVLLAIPETGRLAHQYAVIFEGLDAWDDGDGVIFAFPAEDEETMVGVRLPKADEWDDDIDPDSDGRYAWWYRWYLDLHGRIVAAEPSGGT